MIIACFPGTGARRLFQEAPEDVSVCYLDPESCPAVSRDTCYMIKMREMEGRCDALLIRPLEGVLRRLQTAGTPFTLILPATEAKAEYLRRYREQRRPDTFLEMIDEQWSELLERLRACSKTVITLQPGQQLTDIQNQILQCSSPTLPTPT